MKSEDAVEAEAVAEMVAAVWLLKKKSKATVAGRTMKELVEYIVKSLVDQSRPG